MWLITEATEPTGPSVSFTLLIFTRISQLRLQLGNAIREPSFQSLDSGLELIANPGTQRDYGSSVFGNHVAEVRMALHQSLPTVDLPIDIYSINETYL